MTEPMDEKTIVTQMTVEMATMGGCEFHFSPISMLRAVGLLQLVNRHPGIKDDERLFIRTFVEHGRRFFAHCPTVLEVIRRGDDPTQDVVRADGR